MNLFRRRVATLGPRIAVGVILVGVGVFLGGKAGVGPILALAGMGVIWLGVFGSSAPPAPLPTAPPSPPLGHDLTLSETSSTVAPHEREPCGDDEPEERFVEVLRALIRAAVRVLAITMVIVIFWGVADVVHGLYLRFNDPPYGLLDIGDVLATFGTFMAVLIAIEIFQNIVMYLRSDVIHIKIVLATALMAIARKIIVLDFHSTKPEYVLASAAVMAATGLAYWLIVVRAESKMPK